MKGNEENDPPELTARIAGNIRRWRKARRMTQKQLSDLIGGAASYISTVENMPRMPSFLMAMRIVHHLGISPEQLLLPLGEAGELEYPSDETPS